MSEHVAELAAEARALNTPVPTTTTTVDFLATVQLEVDATATYGALEPTYAQCMEATLGSHLHLRSWVICCNVLYNAVVCAIRTVP